MQTSLGRSMTTIPSGRTILALAIVAMALPAIAGELTLERIFSDPPLEGHAPVDLQLAPGGAYVTFLKPNDRDSDILDLWGAELPGGAPQLLVATEDLLGGKAQRLTEQERMALERKRITKRGITGYLWCGEDAEALIFPFSGDLYLAQLDLSKESGGKPAVSRLTSDAEVPELNPVCSKSGRSVAFVKKGDVVVLETHTKATKQITKGASATRTFGLPEFIAEEEMGRHEGMWWSPDEKSLLVFEVDEAPVGVKVRAKIFSDQIEFTEQRYPAAGEKNAAVRAWLVDLKSGRRVKIGIPAADGYLPRAGFFPDGRAWIEWQSRDQKRLALMESNEQGVLHTIVEETDDAWVELHEDFFGFKDGRRLLWSTERSGRRQLVIVDRQSGAVTPLTDEPEPVKALLGVDQDQGIVFYSAWRERGRQLQAFSIPLAGGAATQLTSEPGWHECKFDDRGRFFVDRRSDFGRPPATVIKDAAGRQALVVDDNPAEELQTFDRPAPQWLDLKAEDGTVLNGLLLPPTELEPGRRYPVIANIYGGPHGQSVTRAWQRSYPIHTYWTEHGYGVFVVDNRGMAGRDRAFTRAHLHRFGDVEVKDLFFAAGQLKAVPWVDADRLGIFGWSYGGFVAARAILDDRTPFAAAVAAAPVTDWTLYDTHYTERYLGMPVVDGKPVDGYTSSNLIARASLLRRPFLVVHGTADDNVLFEHSLRLIEALEKAGKLFDLMIYPGKAHGISGKPSQLHVYKTISAFFDRTLK